MNNKEVVYLAWDIEAGGPLNKNPVIAVGCCYGTSKSYKKIRWFIDFDLEQFDSRCYEEFWSKNLEILNDIKKNSIDAKQAWREIASFLTIIESDYPADNYKIKIVSDNPSYDISKIDYCLEFYTGRKGLHYNDNGSYRGVSDPSEQDKYFLYKSILKDQIKLRAKHSHYPDDDAEVMFLSQVVLDNYKKEELKIITNILNDCKLLIS
jgi:hypothetical protein